ncbi:hypothetical protein DXT76_16830 [Halobacillus trueperi]|uniref:Inner-membrane translocator n=1 Tax=Halobacillus trueperi TaxID=156205 RepID=A0A3D8VIF0_9BACI|nr:hypothetical protein [Halobacillus trueperi]RDY69119.1 hypothetical protein DXT76_16830 [Halobacillus trueperi]
MEFIILAIFLALLNFVVFKYAGEIRMNWISSGLIVMLLGAPIVFFITLYVVGSLITGDGLAGGAAGLVLGFITFINGVVFLIKGLTIKEEKV